MINFSQRQDIYQGEILRLPQQFLPLAEQVEDLWEECFSQPLSLFVPDYTTWDKVSLIRQSLQQNRYKSLAYNLLGVPNARIFGLSFRLLHPNLPSHINNTALCLHRDTWYNLPEHSINVWVAITGCIKENTFRLYPSFFDQKVEIVNYVDASSTQDTTIFPQAPPDIVKNEVFVSVEGNKGDALAFSSHHLHQSCHTPTTVRASLDFRFVVEGEEDLGPLFQDVLRSAF